MGLFIFIIKINTQKEKKVKHMVNNEIKSKVVNLVTEGQKGVTQMLLADAIALAQETDEDVICINEKSDIPVVKIGDYKRFQYEKAKKEKDNRKKARLQAQELKEIVIGDSIAEHDLKIKAKNVDRILKEGDKVKLTIRYKGRSIRLIDQGPEKLQALANLISVDYNIDKTPKIEGNRVTMIISPKK